RSSRKPRAERLKPPLRAGKLEPMRGTTGLASMQELTREGTKSTIRRSRLRRFARLALSLGLVAVAVIVTLRLDAAERPSFECARAATAVEKAICRSDALALLDREIAALYRQRRGRAPGAPVLACQPPPMPRLPAG